MSRSTSTEESLLEFKYPSVIFDTSSDDSSSVFKSKNDNIVTVTTASSIKEGLGKKKGLFESNRANVCRLRKSAILRCFEKELVSSTPTLGTNPGTRNQFFASPIITPIENTNSVSKSKSKKAILKRSIKSFNDEIKETKKSQKGKKSTSVQVDEIYKLKIRESLKCDDNTTKKLQMCLFKTDESGLSAEHDDVFVKPLSRKCITRQTQTSDSLNASDQKSTNKITEILNQNESELSVPIARDAVDMVLNEVDLTKGVNFTNSIITISDISVSEINKNTSTINSENKENKSMNMSEQHELNRIEKCPLMVFSVSPVEGSSEVASSCTLQITDNNDEAVASSKDLLLLSHLNIETELKKNEGVKRKLKKKVSESAEIGIKRTPMRDRLRNRSTIVHPFSNANKRKCKEPDSNRAKKHSPEISPVNPEIHVEELPSEIEQIVKPQEEVIVREKRRGKRSRKITAKEKRARRTNCEKSECSREVTLPKTKKETLYSDLTETSKLELNQLGTFSPHVLLEKIDKGTSSRVKTRSQTKNETTIDDNLVPQHSTDGTNDNESTLVDVTVTKTTKKVTVNLYQYVIHRKSGFYQLPEEPITAASVGGRPQRTRRRPKQFVQAAFIPDIPLVKKTTKFKAEKDEVKNKIRRSYRKTIKAQTPPVVYNLRSNEKTNENQECSLPPPSPSCSLRSSQSIKQSKQKSIPKKKVVKRLDYENKSQENKGLIEESINNVNLFFDKSQVCVSDNTVCGVGNLTENNANENEEDSHFQCLIDNKIVDVKCCSTMPTFKDNSGITAVSGMVNQCQNSEIAVGHLKILPNKKLLVEVNKYLCVVYSVLEGKGVAKIANKEFSITKGSLIYIPLGLSYFIHNNSRLPLILHYTTNSKLK